MPWPQFAVREATVVRVDVCDDRLEVIVAEAGGRTRVLVADLDDGQSPRAGAQLAAWHAAGVPLLLMIDDTGNTHLYGPDGAVAGVLRAPSWA